jgi:tetratricopeptide (TPR) repeat protein
MLAVALGHHRVGNLAKAGGIYRRILRKQPRRADVLHLLGLATSEMGRGERAAQLITKAIAAEPRNAHYRHSLGVVLRTLGRPEEAVASFRAALEIDPKAAMTLTVLGNALKALGRFEEAEKCHLRALEVQPDFVEALSNLGSTYKEAGRLDQAIERFRQALELRPDHPELHYNLGNAWLALGRFEDAEEAFGRAVETAPGHARALSNRGVALREQGRAEDAAASLRAALEIAPDYAEAHWNLGLALLMDGRYEEGWREYEWRARIPDFPMRRFKAPSWDGGPLAGRTLLVHAEQGLGDTLQFARYLRLAADAGGRVVFECPPALASLLSRLEGCDAPVPRGGDLPPFDVQAPLMSLPGLLDPGLEKAAAMVPYLAPDAGLAERWKARLGEDGRLKIGIGWQGNPDYRADRRRSVPLARFSGLTRLEGVRLVSLQKGPGVDQLEGFAAAQRDEGTGIEALGPAFDDEAGAFMDTTAVMTNLDLVIASDTAVPHLAGALGREVWLVLPFAPDWRWGRGGETVPWYPTMRLFRQDRPGDWEGVFERVVGALKDRMG